MIRLPSKVNKRNNYEIENKQNDIAINKSRLNTARFAGLKKSINCIQVHYLFIQNLNVGCLDICVTFTFILHCEGDNGFGRLPTRQPGFGLKKIGL